MGRTFISTSGDWLLVKDGFSFSTYYRVYILYMHGKSVVQIGNDILDFKNGNYSVFMNLRFVIKA